MANDLSSATIGQASINVHDVEKAVAFYRDALGMRFLFQAGPKMAFFDCGGVRLMLAVPEKPEFDHPGSVFYFKVADIQTVAETLASRGAHLDAIYVCPHDEGQCDCRKPLTGLFEQAFRDFPTAHAGNSVVVGDSLRDIEAGRRLGMRTVLIDDGSASPSPDLQLARSLAQVSVASLVDLIDRHLCPERLR